MSLAGKTQSSHNWKDGKKTNHHINNGRLDLRKNKDRGFFKRMSWKGFYSAVFSKRGLMVIGGLALFGAISVYAGIWWLSRGLPDPNKLMERQVAQSTKIYDRTGQTVLYEVSGDVRRTMVSLNDIPPILKQATIVVEDKDFYKHGGISYWAIFRTAVTNVLFGKKAGGSTLTQQFVKNAVLTSEKRYVRKLKEAILAVKLENVFTKDQILQMYLNEIPYGSTAYGVEAAAQKYFGKHVQQINLPEAAVLAALPQSPTYYSPYGSHKEALLARQRYIIDLLAKNGFISEDEAVVAKGVKLNFKEPSNNIAAPHFVMYVKELLADKYGDKEVEQGGLKIITTLDLYKQQAAEETITKYGQVNHDKYQASNAALLSIDPKTGQILAMVGSRDYNNDAIDGQVNIVTSLRQPGSSLKPLVYATAFSKGYTPNTVLYDVVTNFSTDPAKAYEPHNYTGKEYGPVSMRKALAGSLNIPAVKALYLAGIDNVLDFAKDLGYTSFSSKERFGLSLVLGGGEVKMLEHVNAYSAFAREGYAYPTSAILRVEDKDGKVLEEWKKGTEKKVFEPNVAREVNDVLSDNSARAYIFGENNLLTFGSRPVAAKTGTTNDYRDAWTIGYTPSIVTGIWVGNNDFTPMKKGSAAATIAVPIFHDYMSKVLGNTPIEYFKKPEIKYSGKNMIDGTNIGQTVVKIDRASGLLATDLTPASFIEEKIYTQPHCILYYVDKNDPLGDAPKNPADDPQFNLWESRVQAWAAKQNFSTSTPPTEFDNLHIEGNIPNLSVISPTSNETITSPTLSVKIETSSPRGVNRAEYYIDDNLLATNNVFPYGLEKNVGFLANGFHSLRVRVCDDIDNCSEQKVEINLSLKNNTTDSSFFINLASPVNETKYQTKDFPVNLNIALQNSVNISKLTAYYIGADGQEKAISSASMLDGAEVGLSWKKAPAAGVYDIYAKASGWNGQTISTEKIKIEILADKATTTPNTKKKQ